MLTFADQSLSPCIVDSGPGLTPVSAFRLSDECHSQPGPSMLADPPIP